MNWYPGVNWSTTTNITASDHIKPFSVILSSFIQQKKDFMQISSSMWGCATALQASKVLLPGHQLWSVYQLWSPPAGQIKVNAMVRKT